ncbi:hypothetical protein FIBSPDRAFT_860204 [Athelia psychrophila]|uniref:Uncharacterized protein n=1 Tax=Athelia psychrophila TaxID=1759441 RepID=A0A166KE35_9AGAM|nr:hypothetical protein FIBSPDRAFT_860204 [Fibularhizoctonia sp. CBS 109695]
MARTVHHFSTIHASLIGSRWYTVIFYGLQLGSIILPIHFLARLVPSPPQSDRTHSHLTASSMVRHPAARDEHPRSWRSWGSFSSTFVTLGERTSSSSRAIWVRRKCD